MAEMPHGKTATWRNSHTHGHPWSAGGKATWLSSHSDARATWLKCHITGKNKTSPVLKPHG
jgi:hypothetical protein